MQDHSKPYRIAVSQHMPLLLASVSIGADRVDGDSIKELEPDEQIPPGGSSLENRRPAKAQFQTLVCKHMCVVSVASVHLYRQQLAVNGLQSSTAAFVLTSASLWSLQQSRVNGLQSFRRRQLHPSTGRSERTDDAALSWLVSAVARGGLRQRRHVSLAQSSMVLSAAYATRTMLHWGTTWPFATSVIEAFTRCATIQL